MNEPLHPDQAKQLILAILATGEIRFSGHALREFEKDQITTVEAEQVLRSGVVEPPEFDRGSWRYRVRAARIIVVVAFNSQTSLSVVTGWRVKR